MPYRFEPRLAPLDRAAGFALDRDALARGLAFAAAAGRFRDPAEPAACCFGTAAAVVTLGVFGSDGFAAPSLAGALASDFDSSAAGFDSSRSTARLRLLSLSLLKSVSYQPLPFSRKTGADTSFCMVRLPQEGHFTSGGSLIFCITSE